MLFSFKKKNAKDSFKILRNDCMCKKFCKSLVDRSKVLNSEVLSDSFFSFNFWQSFISSLAFAGGWNSALSRAAIEGISTTCKDLRSLSLTGCKGLMGDSLLTVVQSCQVLEKLDLSAVSVFLLV